MLNSGNAFAWTLSLAVATLIASALLPTIRCILNYLANARLERTAMKKASSLRHGGAKLPVQVRQTDLIGNMSAQSRQAFRQAENLLARGSVREAAWIFENIKFQRRAIDELEKAGMIDDACAVLLRMKLPNRAAVLYERHKQLDKAAHYYTEAGLHENAGKVLLQRAHDDVDYYLHAGAAFERAGKAGEAFDAYAALLATERLANLAAAHGLGDRLLSYAVDPELAELVHRQLTEEALAKIIASALGVPRIARLLATWGMNTPSPVVAAEVFRKAAANAATAAAFWKAVPLVQKEQMGLRLANVGLEPRVLAIHTLALSAPGEALAVPKESKRA